MGLMNTYRAPKLEGTPYTIEELEYVANDPNYHYDEYIRELLKFAVRRIRSQEASLNMIRRISEIR